MAHLLPYGLEVSKKFEGPITQINIYSGSIMLKLLKLEKVVLQAKFVSLNCI